MHVEICKSLSDINASDWDALAGSTGNPFLSHTFLTGLETSQSVCPQAGWQPMHLIAYEGTQIVGVMPLYLKGHSQGEYVFDHAWAEAYTRAGGQYYPKLVSAVPFTPVPGPRAVGASQALMQQAMQLAQDYGVSSLHVLFCTQEAWDTAPEGFLKRQDQQFHWTNQGYATFDDFLESLASRKRKAIRKERAQACANDVDIHILTGDQIQPDHWDAFWVFYQDTGARKWGQPYLTRAMFVHLHETMRDKMVLMLAKRDDRWIAGALNFIGAYTLYGRYWGCIEDHPCLHFELCYYQAIEFAINAGLNRVEAGAQGAHKLARGYVPTPTYSLHWIADPGFRTAVAHYLDQERAQVDYETAVLTEMAPYKKGS